MRLSVTRSKNATSLYAIKSTYENGVRSSKIVEKLGTVEELTRKLEGQDPYEWAREYIKELTRKEKEETLEVMVKLSPCKCIAKDERRTFNGGYLFLQALYHQLGLPAVCKKIAEKHKFTFDLDSILSRLLYSRIIYPTSKLGTYQLADKYLEGPKFEIDSDAIAAEEAFDGFYAVCTNLEDDALSIIQVNHRRWQIEECFRILKSEFHARPVYLRRDDRIKAHFTTCFMALVLYRLLEKKLEEKFTCSEIIDTLRNMNFLEIKGEGYTPAYTRTDLTDALHDAFGFRTDFQIMKHKTMKKVFTTTKSR